VEGHDLDSAAERLADALTPVDLDRTLERITAAAVETLPDVDYASITVVQEDGRLQTVAPTDELIRRVDEAQLTLQQGPCFDAAVTSTEVIATDVVADGRFPEYAALATEAGIRAQAGVRILDAGRAAVALNLYSRTPGAFADFDEAGALFARRSAEAIDHERELQTLREAVAARELVGRAVGIAMERYGLSEERAFAFLTRLAHHHSADLALVGGAIVNASADRAE
jgi:GAF domain-containing protein